jgi:arabinose-5-phosphate isomerase
VDPIENARQVIALEIRELQRLHDRVGESFARAVDALRATLDASGKIVVAGVGKSGDIGHKIAATFNSTGAPAVVLNPQNALHGDLGLVGRDDAVIALSHKGETRELLDALPHLKRRARLVIALTGEPDSTLAANSDLVLDTNVEREACPLNLAPTSSSTVMLVLGDALAMVLLQARGFDADAFAELHPGGTLGRVLLTRVSDIMRHGDRLGTVRPTDTVRHALDAMSRSRSGAAVVTTGSGTLLGIFTQGDFARAYQLDIHVGTRPVQDLMTRNPVTITGDRLAVEALRLLESHPVDDLIVTNHHLEVIGLIDTQDLTRFPTMTS